MPKTLAALPSSQYPTAFELVSGKKLLPAVLRALLTVWLGEANGEAVAALLLARDGTGVVLLYRMLRTMVNLLAILVERVGTAVDKH